MTNETIARFFNQIELVWFDPSIYREENKMYTQFLKSELNLKINLFKDIEEAV